MLSRRSLLAGIPAQAGDIDCFTQETYNGSRTTCYYGYPDYQRSITDCNGSRCTTRWA